jgi:hypothetical protein
MRDAKWFAVSVALAAGAMPMSAQTAAQPLYVPNVLIAGLSAHNVER